MSLPSIHSVCCLLFMYTASVIFDYYCNVNLAILNCRTVHWGFLITHRTYCLNLHIFFAISACSTVSSSNCDRCVSAKDDEFRCIHCAPGFILVSNNQCVQVIQINGGVPSHMGAFLQFTSPAHKLYLKFPKSSFNIS